MCLVALRGVSEAADAEAAETAPGDAPARPPPAYGASLRADDVFSGTARPHVPVTVQCPHCRRIVLTDVRLDNGMLVWALAAGTLLVFVPLCWLPFVVKRFKDTVHSCPNCLSDIAVVEGRCCDEKKQ